MTLVCASQANLPTVYFSGVLQGGDRHPRTAGFLLNIDGDQRPQLDISFGKSARFVLMFDGVQTKVQKVALRSATGGLDVEEITLIDPNPGAKASPQH
jgi:hypothetical protein